MLKRWTSEALISGLAGLLVSAAVGGCASSPAGSAAAPAASGQPAMLAVQPGPEPVRFKSEMRTHKDKDTGIEVTQLTDGPVPSGNFYFTNCGWYDGGRKLLFTSTRTDKYCLYSMNLATGDFEQITFEPTKGQSKNPVRDEVCYVAGQTIMAVNLKTRATRKLYTVEAGWHESGGMTISADGRFAYTSLREGDVKPATESAPRAPLPPYVERPRAKRPGQPEALQDRIVQISVDTGEMRVVWDEKSPWVITHLDCSPTQPNLLMFCHEGLWSSVDNRIWVLNVSTGQVWKPHPRRDPSERTGHEYWFADGVTIGWHGSIGTGDQTHSVIGHVRYDGAGAVMDDHFPPLDGHSFSNDGKLVVSDGEGVIRLFWWDGDHYDGPRELCWTGWMGETTQGAHPHPRISPDNSAVVFECELSGHCEVYLAPLPRTKAEFDRLPAFNVWGQLPWRD